MSPSELDLNSVEEIEDEEPSGNRYDSRATQNSGSRAHKRSSNLKDQQSTGRKRAAKLYPLDHNLPCEWKGKTSCGGGSIPITGCVSGRQQARHHGPIKDTTVNDEGNVHRICNYCHARWHAINDVSYDWNNPNGTPHAPRDMTPEELQEAIIDEMRYLGSKRTKFKILD